MIAVTILYFIFVNFIFATLYWFGIGGIGGVGEEGTWVEAFFFSVHTMSTIGYGNYHPKSIYVNCIVCIETWICFFTNATIAGVIITKVQRPARLRHTIKFSNVAVINKLTPYYQADNKEWYPSGVYKVGNSTFSFRIVNLRKRLLCMPELRLLLLMKEKSNYVIYELDFDINRQLGRPRGETFSKPYLQLPWTVVHTIDKYSPLYGKSKTDMINGEFEIICVMDGVDELSSLNFQSRWSYIPDEIIWDHVFVPLVSRTPSGKFQIDYERISDTVPVKEDRDTREDLHNSVPISNDESSPLIRIESSW